MKKNRFITSLYAWLFLLTAVFVSQKVVGQNYSISASATIPDSSAMLDIISNNKGLLIPRVSLSSTTDSATIVHPAISLLVYNTNDSMTGGNTGFWYWNGSQWIRVVGSSAPNELTTDTLIAPVIIGGTGATDSIVYQTTTATGATGADHIFKVGNNGGTEALRILNNGNIGIHNASPTSPLTVFNSVGTQKAVTITHTVTSATTNNTSLNNIANITPSANTAFSGMTNVLTITGSHTLTDANYGACGIRNNTIIAGSNTITNATSFSAILQQTGTATITNATGYRAKTASNSGGTVINNYGFRCDAQTIGSTLNAAYEGAVASGTGRYNLYMDGTAQNYLAGDLGIGTSSPAAKLHSEAATEQLRLGYNAANYIKSSTNSYGVTTINGIGTASGITIIGGDKAASQLILQSTSGNASGTTVATAGVLFNTGNNGATQAGILSNGNFAFDNTASRTISIEATASGTAGKSLTLTSGSTAAGGTNIAGGSLTFNTGLGTGTADNSITFQTSSVLGSGTTLQSLLPRMTITSSGGVGIATTTPHSPLEVSGSVANSYSLLTGATTLDATYYNVNLTNAGSTYAITLPTASGITGRTYRIKQMTGTACTVATTGGQHIISVINTNVEPYSLSVGKGYVEFQSDGTNWIMNVY